MVLGVGKVAKNTPFISLSSGCIEYVGSSRPPIRYPALRTAMRFARRGGKTAGYVFKCWIMTGLKAAPELPGQAEEVRDLNLFGDFYSYHRQGEVTAKLVVPRRQIEWVFKVGKGLQPAPASWGTPGKPYLRNTDFVSPDRVSNVIEMIL